MKLKRMGAYLIDIFVVSFISSLIFMCCFKNSYNNYMEVSEDLTSVLSDTNIDNDELVSYEYKLYKSSSTLTIIKIGVTFVYFVVLQYLRNGKTLGKRIFGIRVVPCNSDHFNTGLFVLREVIISNLLLDFISVLTLILCSKSTWITISGIVSTISYFVYLIIFMSMCLYTDGRSIHDVICKTNVINEREK